MRALLWRPYGCVSIHTWLQSPFKGDVGHSLSLRCHILLAASPAYFNQKHGGRGFLLLKPGSKWQQGSVPLHLYYKDTVQTPWARVNCTCVKGKNEEELLIQLRQPWLSSCWHAVSLHQAKVPFYSVTMQFHGIYLFGKWNLPIWWLLPLSRASATLV